MKNETLHLCNIDEVSDFINYESLISDEDSVVFMFAIKSEDLQAKLKAQFNNYSVYFISAKNNEDYMSLVHLLDEHQRTMTWK